MIANIHYEEQVQEDFAEFNVQFMERREILQTSRDTLGPSFLTLSKGISH